MPATHTSRTHTHTPAHHLRSPPRPKPRPPPDAAPLCPQPAFISVATCPPGYSQVTLATFSAYIQDACGAIDFFGSSYDHVRLANGAACTGSAYGCTCQANDPGTYAATLCTDLQPLPPPAPPAPLPPPPSPATYSPCSPPESGRYHGCGTFSGSTTHGIGSFPSYSGSSGECMTQCASSSGCQTWWWNGPNGFCYLCSEPFAGKVADSNYVSGVCSNPGEGRLRSYHAGEEALCVSEVRLGGGGAQGAGG